MASAEVKEEQKLDYLWKEAHDRFWDNTGKKLNPPLRFEDMMGVLEKKFNPKDPEDGKTQQKIKAIGMDVLNFVQLIGGLAAQGASMVFGPANMCFNAMQVLMNIPGKIAKYHEDIALLFEEIAMSMKRFKIYNRIDKLSNIGFELRETTHRVLIALVDICAMSFKFCNEKPFYKFSRTMKLVIFDDDSGVRSALGKFRRLIEQQKAIQDATTLERVIQSQHDTSHELRDLYEKLNRSAEESMDRLEEKLRRMEGKIDDVKTGTDVLVQAFKQTSSQIQWHKWIKSIREKLNFPNLGKETEIDAETGKASQQIRNNTVQNAGSWLLNVHEYNDWFDVESTANRVLYLSGPSGSGKSTLISTIFNSLAHSYQTTDDVSKTVHKAFANFLIDDKRTTDKNPSATALKSIAIQLAEQSEVYAQKLYVYLEKRGISKDINAIDLSKHLLLPQEMKMDDNYFFLLIDGLDNLKEEDEAKELFEAVLTLDSPNVRVVISGTNEILKICSQDAANTIDSIPMIDIQECNKPDLANCLERNLKKHQALQADDDVTKELVDTIRNELPKIVSGSFKNVKDIIDKVNEGWESEKGLDVVKALISKNSLQNVDSEIEKTIESLNQSLSSPEIQQLNELLIWTIYAVWPISVEMMEAILFLANKTTRQNLKDKVSRKYSKILKVVHEEFYVSESFSVQKPEIAEYLGHEDRPRQGTDGQFGNEPHISMTIQINNVPLSKAQRFFWDLSEKGMFNNFSFTDNAIRVESNSIISANKVDAELSIVRLCFNALFREADERTKVLDSYFTGNLVKHLSHLKGYVQNEELQDSQDTAPKAGIQHNFLRPSERKEIIENLVSLLQSPECIERHLSNGFLYSEHFLDETDGLPVIQEWLKDSQTANLPYQHKNWIRRVINGNLALALEKVAIMIAEHWLCKREWNTEQTYSWLNAYLDRLQFYSVHTQLTQGSEVDDATGDIEPEQQIPERDRIQRAIDWAEKEAKIITKDAIRFERLGQTYFDHKEHSLAKEQLLKAKEMTGCSWQALKTLAESYAALEDLEAAVEQMKVILAQLKANENLTAEERDSVVQILIRTAHWQAKLKRPEHAVIKLREAIQIEAHSYRGYYELLKLYVDMQRELEAIKLLEELNEQPSENNNLSKLGSMMLYFLDQDEYFLLDCFETVFRATRYKKTFAIVLETLEETLAFSKSSKKHSDITSTEIDLRLCHGVAIAQHTVEDDRYEKALEIWKECIKVGFDSAQWSMWYSGFFAATFVLDYYHQNASLFDNRVNDVEDHITELNTLLQGACKNLWYGMSVRLMLAGLYRKADLSDKAEKLLIKDMKSGLGYLFDEDPKNDFRGYQTMGEVLLHTGDYLNAVSAWSLYGPKERREGVKKDAGPQVKGSTKAQDSPPVAEQDHSNDLGYHCDGRCDKEWTWSTNPWACKICADVQFCDECITELLNGTLKRVICSPNHEWLHMPSWREEYNATGADCVRIGGKLEPPCGQFQEGKRIGGEIVPIDQWRDSIKKDWEAKEKSATEDRAQEDSCEVDTKN